MNRENKKGINKENYEENEEPIWSEGAYAKTLSTIDPNFQERIRYFDEKNNDKKEFNCKKCNKAIGKHNLYWHEGMCNQCFFDTYNM